MTLDLSGLDSRIFDALSEATDRQYYYICNLSTNVSRWSRKAVDYFGLPGEYMYDAALIWANLLHSDDRAAFLNDIAAVFYASKPAHSMEYRVRTPDGNYVLCSCHGSVKKGEAGEPDLFVGTITNHGVIENVDSVTNFYNVYEFLRATQEICRNKEPACFLMIGLSKFQDINDLYGYSFGNRVLRQIAAGLRELVQNAGTIYRMDGPKFCVMLRHADVEAVQTLHRKIRDYLQHHVIVNDNHVPLSLGFGALILNGEIGNENSIRTCINYALEFSKHQRHGELVFFDDSLQKGTFHALELIALIRQSVLNDCYGFYLRYQPLVDPVSQNIIGAEALLRWRSATAGEISPAFFIPLLECDPCFSQLGAWIIQHATQDMKPVVDAHPDFILNINVSHIQLETVGFRDIILDALQASAFPAKNLCIELTERCQDLDVERLQDEIRFFHSRDIKISLDDFGTGAASLGLLRDLPVDSLKVDGSFISHIHTDRTNQIILDCLLTCGNALGIQICLEGVETAETREFLNKYLVKYHQGFYYSRPVPIEEFLTLMQADQ